MSSSPTGTATPNSAALTISGVKRLRELGEGAADAPEVLVIASLNVAAESTIPPSETDPHAVRQLLEEMQPGDLRKLCDILLSVPAATDAAVAHLGFEILIAAPQHCILCHKEFSKPGGCKVEQYSQDGYDRGECPSCRERDSCCGPCMLCRQPQCENEGSHDYCYQGMHISDVKSLDKSCTLDLEAPCKHLGCKPCMEQYAEKERQAAEKVRLQKERREAERQRVLAERQALALQARAAAAALKK